MAGTEPNSWADELHEGVVLARDGRIAWLNRRAGELLAVDPSRAQGMPVIAVLRDHRLERVLLEGRELELEARGRLLRARPITGGMALLDVSDERRAREEARNLLAVLSHELRTPATAILSTLEALQHDLDGELRERFLQRAERECDRLIRLIADLTVESSPPRARSVRLSEVLMRAEPLLRETFAEHEVRFRAEGGDFLVWADEDKLLQVLLNLLENAAVHGPEGGEVSLTVEPDGETSGYLAVKVRDQGRPLPAGAFERFFLPHSRGRNARAAGRGLGLYIVRSVTERWQGRCWGRPTSSGNEFGFTVPRDSSAQAAASRGGSPAA